MAEQSEQYYRHYLEAARSHWWFRGREQVLQAVIRPLVRLAPGTLIIDVGSGPGGPTRALFPEGRIVAIDVSPMALAAYPGGAQRVVGDGTQVPCQTARASVVCAFDVLEHLDDDREALRNWHRVLVPGGWLLLTVPAYPFLWSRHDVANGHRRRYDASSLRRRLTAAGFTVVRLTYFNSLLLPAIALVRWARRLERQVGRDEAPQPVVELDCQVKLPRWLERCCEGALQCEAAWLRGHRLPAGVSLCAVAQHAALATG